MIPMQQSGYKCYSAYFSDQFRRFGLSFCFLFGTYDMLKAGTRCGRYCINQSFVSAFLSIYVRSSKFLHRQSQHIWLQSPHMQLNNQIVHYFTHIILPCPRTLTLDIEPTVVLWVRPKSHLFFILPPYCHILCLSWCEKLQISGPGFVLFARCVLLL